MFIPYKDYYLFSKKTGPLLTRGLCFEQDDSPPMIGRTIIIIHHYTKSDESQ